MAGIIARRAAKGVLRDEALRKYFSNVLILMGFGVALTGIIAEWVVHSPGLMGLLVTGEGKETSVSWVWITLTIIELGLVFLMCGFMEKNSLSFTAGAGVFAFYAALNGLTLGPALSLYTDASVLKVFLISASTFGACALYGHTTKKNLLPMGTFFLMGLVGLIIAMLVNMFLHSPMVDFVTCGVGVLIFAGLTAWDMQALREIYDERGNTTGVVVFGALSLYLDFINLFLMFLRLFGAPKD